MKSGIWLGAGALLFLAAATSKKPSPKKPVTPPGKGKGPVVVSDYSGELSGLSSDPYTRSAEIVSLFKQGRGNAPLTIIETASGPYRAKLAVSSKAATIDGVRVNLSERELTNLADYFGAHLLTPKLVDVIQEKADLKLTPRPQAWYADGPGGRATMADTSRMFDYSKIVDEEAAGKTGTLTANEGKDWVLEGYAFTDRGKNRGTNYGWFKNGAPVQPLGRVHDLDHTDYSQLVRLVSSYVQLSEDQGSTWRDATFEEIVTSPKLFSLVSYERLPAARHPGVLSGSLA
jgi:hypothetical protein